MASSIDLFAGAGGLSEGFKQLGVVSIFANDHEGPALQTYRHNHPDAICSGEPIQTIDPHALRIQFNLEKGDLDVLLGGPPCQGFSTYGKRDPNDHRNQLYNYYLAFLDEFHPKAFVIENVVGILSMEDGAIIDDIVGRTTKFGYGVKVLLLDAVSFGVPQFRKRVFIVGGSENSPVPEPEPIHESGNGIEKEGLQRGSGFLFDVKSRLLPALTVRDAIDDLPEVVLAPSHTHESISYPARTSLTAFQKLMRESSAELTHHSSKRMLAIRRFRLMMMKQGDYGNGVTARFLETRLSKELIEQVLSDGIHKRDLDQCRTEDRQKEEEFRKMLEARDTHAIAEFLASGGFANKYRRLAWDAPSHTLVAHMARDCSDFVHPEYDRFLSVREAARLQSFPDRYYFHGSQFQQLRQIGNAVPPLLAAAVARSVAQVWDQVEAEPALPTSFRYSTNVSATSQKLKT